MDCRGRATKQMCYTVVRMHSAITSYHWIIWAGSCGFFVVIGAKFCGLASVWSILTLILTTAYPVRPAVGWRVPRAHRDAQGWRLSLTTWLKTIYSWYGEIVVGQFDIIVSYHDQSYLLLCAVYIWGRGWRHLRRLTGNIFSSWNIPLVCYRILGDRLTMLSHLLLFQCHAPRYLRKC